MRTVYEKRIDSGKMLEEIRALLGISIEKMCSDMGWMNVKYYDFVKNGKRNEQGEKVKSSPTVNKLFDGINFALTEHVAWGKKYNQIIAIITRHIFVKKS